MELIKILGIFGVVKKGSLLSADLTHREVLEIKLIFILIKTGIYGYVWLRANVILKI